MRSRTWLAVPAAAGLCALSAAACNVINGLNEFEKIDCVGVCSDANPFPDVQQPKEAGPDAKDAATEEASAPETGPDAGPDVIEHDAPTTVARRWARWHMPNFPPEAGLPNEAKYSELYGGSAILDEVTQLQWERQPVTTPMTYEAAVLYCQDLKLGGVKWVVPTRIELSSLLDPTNSPSIAKAVFQPEPDAGDTVGPYWTSSPVSDLDVPKQWTVDFTEAKVQKAKNDSDTKWRVRCVHPGN